MPFRFPKVLRVVTILTAGSALINPALSQTGTISQVVLDPVPIRVISSPDDDEDGSYQAEELVPRPALEALTEPVEDPIDYLPEETLEIGEESIGRYERQVEALIANGGSYNQELGESLLDLGAAYEIIGSHGRALEVYEEAYHLNRIHNGLFNLQQVPIVQRITESHISLGQLQEAHQQQDYLHYLYNKLDDETLDEAYLLENRLALAEWNMRIANTARNYQFSSTLDFQLQRLLDAEQNYTAVVSQLSFDDPKIPHIEMQRAKSNFLTVQLATLMTSAMTSSYYLTNTAVTNSFADGFESGLQRRLDFYKATSYSDGSEALESRLGFLEAADDHDVEAIIRALVDLADWNLYYQRRGAALDYYDQAYSLLDDERLNDTEALRLELFSPAVPVPVPGFITRPNSREAYGLSLDLPLRYQGLVDLGFRLDRYGKASRIELLDSRHNAESDNFNRELRRDISRTLYRPHFDDTGTPINSVEVTMRYYYTYMPAPFSRTDIMDTATEEAFSEEPNPEQQSPEETPAEQE